MLSKTLSQEWFSNIRADLLAGTVVALALIPEAIAFSIIAGVDPKVGLYASFCIAVVTAFFGGRPGMISAATGAMALLMVTLVKEHGLHYRKSRVSPDNIQLSRDGGVASGMAPWPKAGLFAADEADGPFLELGFGCWTSTSPDSSRLLWVLDGSHRKVLMITADGRQRWDVSLLPTGEGTDGQFYHPRWSNHARVIAVTGPYLRTPETGERSVINQGGATADVYLGRLSATADNVEEWLQLTNSGRGDAYPHVWVAEGHLSELQLADATVPSGR